MTGRCCVLFSVRYRLHRADAAVPEHHVLWKKRACGWYIRIDNFIHTTVFTSRSFSPPNLFFLPSLSQLLHAHTHTPHTQLITTHRTHTYSSTHNLLHTNPSPSLFSFLLSPCHLYLSFAACWKKLTCGVIRSFNLCVSLSSLVSIDAEDSALRRQTKEVATHLTESCSKA